jgi:hypothetical protein
MMLSSTATKSERIMVALEMALAGTPGLGPRAGTTDMGPRIWRDRYEPVSREECPCLRIFPETEPHDQGPTLPVLDAALLVQMELSISRRPLSTLADPIRGEVHRRVMADRTLGGLAYDIHSMGAGWDGESGEIGVVRLRYIVKFRTARGDLTQDI